MILDQCAGSILPSFQNYGNPIVYSIERLGITGFIKFIIRNCTILRRLFLINRGSVRTLYNLIGIQHIQQPIIPIRFGSILQFHSSSFQNKGMDLHQRFFLKTGFRVNYHTNIINNFTDFDYLYNFGRSITCCINYNIPVKLFNLVFRY